MYRRSSIICLIKDADGFLQKALLNCRSGFNASKVNVMKLSEESNIRRVKLQGAYNFRDLGGYRISEGKKIKWGIFFRSDNLSKLSSGDLNRIGKLNLQLIVDLRSKEERVSRPNRLPWGTGIKIKNIEIADNNKSHNDLKQEIFYGRLGETDLEEMIVKAYKRAVTDYQNELALFFKVLLNPSNYPVLVLCNAGKDRTGVVVALVLMALGVSKQAIMEDYMLSKVFLGPMIKRMTTKVRWMSLFRADISQLKKIMDTRVDFLNTTFAAIERNFGSTESFFDSLGMDIEKRKLLREILCE